MYLKSFVTLAYPISSKTVGCRFVIHVLFETRAAVLYQHVRPKTTAGSSRIYKARTASVFNGFIYDQSHKLKIQTVVYHSVKRWIKEILIIYICSKANHAFVAVNVQKIAFCKCFSKCKNYSTTFVASIEIPSRTKHIQSLKKILDGNLSARN